METNVLSDLNDEQREAALAVRGPVCILAGAGTGKTTTITRRIAHQVSSGAFAPDEILAVTFTDKAAREMALRLKALGVPGVRAKTFHAEALAQVRKLGGDVPEILPSKAQLLHGIAQRLPVPYRFMALRDLATEIEWAKNRRVPPARYRDALDGHQPPIPEDLMYRVYVEYEKRKSRAERIDFEDLLERALEILHEDERALSMVHARYRAFTVDEYQDVNLLQQALLDAWAGSRVDVCVVGDDRQSIFGFTGATPRYLLDFPDRHPGCRVVRLSASYRSTPEVLAIANRLAPKLGGSTNPLRAIRANGPSPTVRSFATGAEEIDWIVAEIRRLHDDGVAWERISVLHRINGRSEELEEAFSRGAIPFQMRDGSFLRRPAARTMLARLRHELDGDVAATVRRVAANAGHDPERDDVSDEEATRQADLGRMIRLAEEFAGTSLQAFVADIRSRFAEDDEGRGVVLMTYHRAKGLEFDAVFLPRLEDKELPFALARTDDEIAEERRLLYVGITRARRHLYLSHASYRETERRKRPKPSPFIADLVGTVEGGRPATPLIEKQRPGFGEPLGGTPLKVDVVARVADDPVFELLRSWRLDVSREAGVPAYVVFDNKTLAFIAMARPETRAALLAVPGVGPAKLDRYAEDVLRIVRSA